MNFSSKKTLLIGTGLIIIGVSVGIILSINFNLTTPGTANRVVQETSKPYFQQPGDMQQPATVNDSLALLNVKTMNRAFIMAAKSVIPAVVSVKSDKLVSLAEGDNPWYHFWEIPNRQEPRKRDDDNFRQYYRRGLGSGIIISEDGYILTNNHVIEDTREIDVILYDKRQFIAKRIGSDIDTDIALLKIDAQGLPKARFGDAESLEIGEWVLAIGTPFQENLNSTVTAGIVSAKGRNIQILRERSNSSVEYFIQTDAVINPGNSGGPLINLHGEVIGINTAILSYTGNYQGYSFSIPINLAINVAEDLRQYGKVMRGFIGINIQDITYDQVQALKLKSAEGVLINDFVKGGPAKEAGLEIGDVIIAIDNHPITRSNELQNMILTKEPGDQVKVTVYRNQESKDFWVTLHALELPNEKQEQKAEKLPEPKVRDFPHLGIEVQTLTEEQLRKQTYGQYKKGVIVLSVNENSEAGRKDIRPGDLIWKVDQYEIVSAQQFYEILEKLKKGNPIIFYIVNERGENHFVTLTIPNN
ncbi:MAG: Do family serine endopeptidase [Patescibacteria group bacterium]|nr:Do family serine endopeptidase [Patescibacteria group bacterium]